MTSPTGTQAVDRAAQLLIQVARHREPVSFTQLTAASGLAKSTTSRLLMALERNGLVRRDGAGRFSPGEVFLSYAWRGGAEADLVSVAQPVLAQLGEQTGETVNLGVPRDGGLVEQIAQVDSRYLIGGTNWVGLTVPLHCAALGKVLLAFGAAELPEGQARAAHRPDHHQPRGAGGRARRGPRARLRGHCRGAGARPRRRRGAGLRRRHCRRRPGGGRGAVGVRPGEQARRRPAASAADACMAAARSLSALLGHDSRSSPDAKPPAAKTQEARHQEGGAS